VFLTPKKLKKSNVLYNAGVVASASNGSKRDNPVKMRNVIVNVSPFVYINPSIDPCALMVKVIRIDTFKAPVMPPRCTCDIDRMFYLFA